MMSFGSWDEDEGDEESRQYSLDRDEAFALTVAQYRKQYEANRKAKVGEMIACPICGKKMPKRTYHHSFCSTRHKDKYWNRVDEERRFRALLFC